MLEVAKAFVVFVIMMTVVGYPALSLMAWGFKRMDPWAWRRYVNAHRIK